MIIIDSDEPGVEHDYIYGHKLKYRGIIKEGNRFGDDVDYYNLIKLLYNNSTGNHRLLLYRLFVLLLTDVDIVVNRSMTLAYPINRMYYEELYIIVYIDRVEDALLEVIQVEYYHG